MIIVKILGGFASQLRHYGVGYLLAQSKHTELFLDLSDYVEGYFRPFMLSYVSIPECGILRNKAILSKAISVSSGRQLIELFEEDEMPDVYLGCETANYKDFFEKYPSQYPGIEFELFRTLKFSFDSPFLDSFQTMIKKNPGIGVHVRLGDFDELGVADSIEKYKSAIGWILKKNPDYLIYFFSNDVQSTIRLFGNSTQYKFIDYQNGYPGDVEEFFALSMCQEKIIATRSGYSRYAAYLGMNQYGSKKAVCLEDLDNLSKEFVFLDDNQLQEGMKIYSEKIKSNADEVDYIGSEFLPEIRYDTVCWNHIIGDQEEEKTFWKDYYGYTNKQPDEKSYIFRSMRKYNRWYEKGLYLRAIMNARIGRRVLYICPVGSDSFGMKIDELVSAKDMDGNDLGFDILISKDKDELKKIVADWITKGTKEKGNGVVRIQDSPKNIIRGLMKRICKDRSSEDCKYLPSTLSQLRDNPVFINEMLEKQIGL